MAIKFQNLKLKTSRTRPKGYAYPIGLTFNQSAAGGAVNNAIGTTGGTQLVDDSYAMQNTIHYFTTSGQFNPSFHGEAEVLMIAGGGGGGAQIAGGGGGGGLIYIRSYPLVSGSNVYFTIGAGGTSAQRGGNTILELGGSEDIFAHGGGNGGPSGTAGVPGGSGGGGGRFGATYGVAVNPMSPTPLKYSVFGGNNGSAGSAVGNPDNNGQGGGGGGAGAAGGAAGPSYGGGGGVGLTFSIDTTNQDYSAGGGGGAWGGGGGGGGGPSGGTGGNGGTAGSNAAANRGGGGGGGAYPNQNAGTGASGYAVVRYRTFSAAGYEIN